MPKNRHVWDDALITESTSSAASPRNPYRAILGREYPEPLIALLVFVLGVWLWDHHVAGDSVYRPGTTEMALVKVDRDLRLADEMAEAPGWFKCALGVPEPGLARQRALQSFQQLADTGQLGAEGLRARAVIQTLENEGKAGNAAADLFTGMGEMAWVSADPGGRWWDALRMRAITPRPSEYLTRYQAASEILAERVVAVRATLWLVALLGVAFIPGVIRQFRSASAVPPRGYAARWTLSLGLMVFLMASLAWIGFGLALEIGVASLAEVPPWLSLLLDSVARLLPCLIALGFLFTRPVHAARVLGLNQAFSLKSVIGALSLLTMLDLWLRIAFRGIPHGGPAGGLSAADAGLWGLIHLIVSACLLAPVAEEVLYRGILFRAAWNRLGVWPAAVFTSMIFAGLHFYGLQGVISVATFGIVSAWLYVSTGSLGACIALHFLYNLTIKLPNWIIYHASLG